MHFSRNDLPHAPTPVSCPVQPQSDLCWLFQTPHVSCYANLCQFLSLFFLSHSFLLSVSLVLFPFFFFFFLSSLLLAVFISPRTLLLSTVVAVTVTPAPPTVPPSYRCTLPALLPRCCLHTLVSSCPISVLSHFASFFCLPIPPPTIKEHNSPFVFNPFCLCEYILLLLSYT